MSLPDSVAMDTSRCDADASSGGTEAEETPVVVLVCGTEEPEALRRATGSLLCDLVLVTTWPEDDAELRDRVAGVLVSDTVDDPLALCRRISAHCPVALLTSDARFEFRLAATRAGVDALLPRPLDVNELDAWLGQLAHRRDFDQFSVLAVDDDPVLLSLYAATLRMSGIKVDVATSATEAYDRLAGSTPDLILLDIQMPEVDGIEFARVIRQSRRFLSVPIVFVSAERDPRRQLEARRFGGDEFVIKPIDLDYLVSIVRLRAERAEVVRLAMERDGLTGLLNHSHFKDRLAQELDRCARSGCEISLAMIDLDRFKQINDTHGHLTGDAVIRRLATTLMSGLRRIDIVGRYGGEEFGVIMLDTSPNAAVAAIDRQRLRFRELGFAHDGQLFQASFSAGLAGSRDYPTVDAIIGAADRALYVAKRNGRDRVMVVETRACRSERG